MTIHRSRIFRLVRARPRLFIATTIGIAIADLLPIAVASHASIRLLIAWNAGTCLYVLTAAIMMIRSTIDPQVPAVPDLALHRDEHRPAGLVGMPVPLAAQLVQ